MTPPLYAFPPAGLPGQDQLCNSHAVFTQSYAVLPSSTMRDIVTSFLPHWQGTRAWVLARPLSGFAETFTQMIVEVDPNGGSDQPEPIAKAEAVLFVLSGAAQVTIDGTAHDLKVGSYAYLAAGTVWTLHNTGDAPLRFTWVRRGYESVAGWDAPPCFVTHEDAVQAVAMPDTGGAWATKRFVDPADLRHDMHVNIVEFDPGGSIPFLETHVMEHGILILEGKAVYRLNRDWVEVAAGDFLWLRAFCPQACYAGGPGRFRYLLYKDVNRHMPLTV